MDTAAGLEVGTPAGALPPPPSVVPAEVTGGGGVLRFLLAQMKLHH